MSCDRYPGIGFDPAPGDPAAVDLLQQRLTRCAEWLDAAHGLVERTVRDDPAWQGAAGAAFRDHLGSAPGFLDRARASLQYAAARLRDWHGELLDHQAHARQLDGELLRARSVLRETAATAGTATVPEGSAAWIDATTAGLVEANGTLGRTRAEIDRLLARARELESAHTDAAGRVAEALRREDPGPAHRASPADRRTGLLGPLLHELDAGVSAVGRAVYDHAGTISSIAGFLALFPTPLTPLLAGTAIATGALQLDKDVRDPALWSALWPPRAGADSLGAVLSLGGDVAGVLPGVGAVARGGAETVRALQLAAETGRTVRAEELTGEFLGSTVRLVSRRALDEARVAPVPGMSAAETAARQRHILVGRGVAGAGAAAALWTELSGGGPGPKAAGGR